MEFPTNAPLNDAQTKQLGSILSTLNPQQVAWVSGFLAGVQSSEAGAQAIPAAERKLTVLYGTESGNAEEVAEQVFKTAKKKGFKAQIVNMANSEPADIKDAGTLLVVVSTWGDGEPPEAAEEFYNTLMAGGLSLSGVDFSVCALGDTGYEQFCQTGKDVDAQLEKLGAKRFVDRVDCDVDYDDRVAAWSNDVWAKLGDGISSETVLLEPAPAEVFDKKNPFPAEVLDNQLLSGEYSDKETIHIEFSLEGSGLEYQPGDVLAVVPRNAQDVVDSVIKAAGLSADDQVELKGGEKKSLLDALTHDLDITRLSRKVISSWQTICGSDDLAQLLAPDAKEDFKQWNEGRQIVDLLEEFPAAEINAQQLIGLFRKLPIRLYSIASSPKAHPGEVHLTVAAVRYDFHGKSRKGVASTFLADEALKGTSVSVYVHYNKNFRLPENSDIPIIMIGPGTGVAPFRAFVEERAETGAKGESWLFFGDQCYNEDFLYQLEWQDYLKEGHLTRLDVAFSRDQPEKVYVQHKMVERSAELWSWLEKGAHFYVCGDASRMAKDVHQTLIEIISKEGGKTEEEAHDYVTNMRKVKRYQTDVY